MTNIKPSLGLVFAAVFSVLVSFFSFSYAGLLPLLFLSLIQIKILPQILKKLIFINFFVIILVFFVFIQAGFSVALELFFRVNFIFLFNLLIFFRSSGYDIVRGLVALGFGGVFVSVAYFSVSLNLWAFSEFSKIKQSLFLRGFRPKTNVFTYKTMANILALLIFKFAKKTKKLNSTLNLRGFKGEIFMHKDKNFSTTDLAFLLVMLIFIIWRIYELFYRT